VQQGKKGMIRKRNRTVKKVLQYLRCDRIISDGEYARIWNDYKQLHKESKGGKGNE
jgi:hypothetical protein